MIPTPIITTFGSSPATEDISFVKGSIFNKVFSFKGCDGNPIPIPAGIALGAEVTDDSGALLFSIPASWVDLDEGRLELLMDSDQTAAIPTTLFPMPPRKTFQRIGRYHVYMQGPGGSSERLVFVLGNVNLAEV